PGSSVYSMTKAAVAVLARGLAIDFAPRGITVNTAADFIERELPVCSCIAKHSARVALRHARAGRAGALQGSNGTALRLRPHSRAHRLAPEQHREHQVLARTRADRITCGWED